MLEYIFNNNDIKHGIYKALANEKEIRLNLCTNSIDKYFISKPIVVFDGLQKVTLDHRAKQVAAFCCDKYIRIWKNQDTRVASAGEALWPESRKIPSLVSPNCLAFNGRDTLLAVASQSDMNIKIYDIENPLNDFLLSNSQEVSSLFFNDKYNLLVANYATGGFTIWNIYKKKVFGFLKNKNAHCSFSQCDNQIVVCRGAEIQIRPMFSMSVLCCFGKLPLSQQFFIWSLFKNKTSMSLDEIRVRRRLVSNLSGLSRSKKICWKLFNNLPENVQRLCLALERYGKLYRN